MFCLNILPSCIRDCLLTCWQAEVDHAHAIAGGYDAEMINAENRKIKQEIDNAEYIKNLTSEIEIQANGSILDVMIKRGNIILKPLTQVDLMDYQAQLKRDNRESFSTEQFYNLCNLWKDYNPLGAFSVRNNTGEYIGYLSLSKSSHDERHLMLCGAWKKENTEEVIYMMIDYIKRLLSDRTAAAPAQENKSEDNLLQAVGTSEDIPMVPFPAREDIVEISFDDTVPALHIEKNIGKDIKYFSLSNVEQPVAEVLTKIGFDGSKEVFMDGSSSNLYKMEIKKIIASKDGNEESSRGKAVRRA